MLLVSLENRFNILPLNPNPIFFLLMIIIECLFILLVLLTYWIELKESNVSVSYAQKQFLIDFL